MKHGLSVGNQLIEGRKVKVLAEQPQGHQLICRDLEDKAIVNIYLQPLSGVLRGCHMVIPGVHVHRFKREKARNLYPSEIVVYPKTSTMVTLKHRKMFYP